ncbi:hypothetical protein ABT369_38970 [Dactylosporangium sp. NPDC000244]|uniref:hypothetical protein n=1 Tax=Dactylosporangium sp. NPDC000244 TaxID=3154365 RepID=UPI00332BA145
MSQHLSDPRVRQVGGHFFVVTGRLDEYEVFAARGEWLASPMVGRPVRSDEREAWVERHTTRHNTIDDALAHALSRVGPET